MDNDTLLRILKSIRNDTVSLLRRMDVLLDECSGESLMHKDLRDKLEYGAGGNTAMKSGKFVGGGEK